MSVTLKSIDMTLDASSIDMAIKEVQDFRKQLEECLIELAEYLVSYGQEVARINLVAMDANFTGTLIDNGIQGFYDKDNHVGAVYTDQWYAVFVEYGTGMMHPGESEYPGEVMEGYKRDHNHRGANGWWYPAPWGWWIPKEGKYKGELMAWTRGMPNRPFMYNTLRELEQIAENEGIDFFRIR